MNDVRQYLKHNVKSQSIYCMLAIIVGAGDSPILNKFILKVAINQHV